MALVGLLATCISKSRCYLRCWPHEETGEMQCHSGLGFTEYRITPEVGPPDKEK